MFTYTVSKWLLPTSLAINVFLATLVGSHFYHRDMGPPPPPTPERIMEEIAQTLPVNDAGILRRIFAEKIEKLSLHNKAKHMMPDKVRHILTADDFSPEKLKDAFAEWQKNNLEADLVLEEIIVSTARQISPEGRKKLAAWAPPRRPPPPR